jgi:hypothetical protein
LNKKAFTLVEIIMATLIAAMVLTVMFKLLAGGIKMTTSGSSHLTNMTDAELIMQRLAADLETAVSIETAEASIENAEFKLKLALYSETSSRPDLKICTFRPGNNGIGLARDLEGEGEHLFGTGNLVSFGIKIVSVPPQDRKGAFVTVEVSTPPEEQQKHILKRFVYLANLSENRQKENLWLE